MGNLYSGANFDTWYGELLFFILVIVYFYFLIAYFEEHWWLVFLSFPLGLIGAPLCDSVGIIIDKLIK